MFIYLLKTKSAALTCRLPECSCLLAAYPVAVADPDCLDLRGSLGDTLCWAAGCPADDEESVLVLLNDILTSDFHMTLKQQFSI